VRPARDTADVDPAGEKGVVAIPRAAQEAICRLRADAGAQITDLGEELAAIVAGAAAEVPDDEHDAEGSTIGYERARISALLDHARRVLEQLDQATTRMELGTYGRCGSCNREIHPERLAAVPTATRCLSCQVDDERRRMGLRTNR
jgi:DnaK suppressor protein